MGNMPSASFGIISCNGSGWSSFKLVAQSLSSRVILGQEVATLDASVDVNSRWLSSCGFHSFWAPSRPTIHDGVSAGVLVAADCHLHPFVPPSFSLIVIPHRCVCALVPMGKLGIVACYSFCGLTGGALDSTNLGHLNDVGNHIISHGYPWISWGGFNFAPELLEGSDFVPRIRGVTFRPDSPTCFSGTSSTVLDYFVVDSRISQAVVSVETLDSPCRPHTPVRLSLDLSVPMDVVIHACTFKSLPTCRPFGPQAVADLPESAFEDFHTAALSIPFPFDPHPDDSGRHLSTADVCIPANWLTIVGFVLLKQKFGPLSTLTLLLLAQAVAQRRGTYTARKLDVGRIDFQRFQAPQSVCIGMLAFCRGRSMP